MLLRILAGERNPNAVIGGLDATDALIVGDMLRGLLGVGFEQGSSGAAEAEAGEVEERQGLTLEELLDLVAHMMASQSTRSYRGYDFSLTERIIGVCIEVHRTFGPGFQEIIYQRALELELAAAGLEFAREVDIPVYYKGKKIGTRRVDFLIEECMLEIKAKSVFAPEDYVQAESYVKAAGYALGLLINFGSLKIQIKRIVNYSVGRPSARNDES